MRHGKIVAVAVLGAFVAAVPFAAQGQTMKDKIENKAEQTKDRVKSATGEARTAVKDSWITAKTKIALFADQRVKGRQVNVDTKNGVVALRGAVDSPAAKQAATEIARGIEGAKSVRNDLQVSSAPTRATSADGKDLATAVETRLSRDSDLKKVAVQSNGGGVVTLTGEVPSITVAARASETARGVPGVTAVKNDLTVLETK